jgi:hypothetical protein
VNFILRKKSIAAFILILGLSIPVQTFAFQKTQVPVEEKNDFIVEPGKTQVFLNPGESVTRNVTITSRIKRPVTFRLSAEDLVGSSDVNQTVVLLGDERGPYSLRSFLYPEITDFTLNFGERITIPVTITIPPDAEPRGYYGAVIIANQPEELQGDDAIAAQGKTRIISRIGSLFLVRVNGETKEEGKIHEFKTIGPKKMFYENRPEGFEVAYTNSGSVHLVPYGTINIKNIFGRTVEKLPIDAYFVLPDSTRYRQVQWSKGFAFGRYTAHLSLYKGYGNEYDTRTVSFWILPWKILTASFVGLIIVISIFYYFFTRFELRKK